MQQFELLATHGLDVELLYLSSDDLELATGGQVIAALALGTGVFSTAPPVEWLADADLLHIHNTFPTVANNWLAKFQLPKIVTLHNYRAFCANGLFLRNGARCTDCVTHSPFRSVVHGCYRESRLRTLPLALQQCSNRSLGRLLAASNKVLAPSEPMREVLEEFGVGNTRTLHNPVLGVDLDLPSSDHAGNWLFAGRLSAEKGLVDLLQIWPTSEPIVVAGDGPQRLAAEELAAARRLRATFLGTQGQTEVRGLMATCRGLVFPSKALEGAPLVYGESLQQGLPLVAAQGSTLATQVELDGTGATFNWRVPGSLAAAIRFVKHNEPVLSHKAKQVFADRYSADVWLREIEKIYREISVLT